VCESSLAILLTCLKMLLRSRKFYRFKLYSKVYKLETYIAIILYK